MSELKLIGILIVGIIAGFVLYSVLFPTDYEHYQSMMRHSDEGFYRWKDLEEKVTTELIPCSANSNVYKRIDIHRNYGVPRFGIITDCASKIDTVWYVPKDYINDAYGGIILPDETDTSITIIPIEEMKKNWNENPFIIVVTDILTGKAAFAYKYEGEHLSLFPDFSPVDTTSLIDADKHIKIKRDENLITIYYGNNIPNGLYFLSIITNTNKIIYMKTIRKGIEIYTPEYFDKFGLVSNKN